MKRLLFTAVLLLCVSAADASTNDAAWKADIEYLTKELPRRHVNAFFHTSQSAFERASASLIASLPARSDAAVVVGVEALVAMIGDTHTALFGWQRASYPLQAYWFDEGVFVTRAAEEHADLLGCRIVAIGGKPIAEVAEAVSAVFAHENESWKRSQVPAYLVAADVLEAVGVVDDATQASFTFEAPDGRIFERTLRVSGSSTGWVEPPVALSRRNAERSYWAEYLAASGTLYIKYNRCRNDPGQPFATFVNQTMANVGARPLSRLIIDLRDNPGGDSSVFQPLISRIQSSPAINRPDRLFVLIGRRTFSSAVINAIQLDQQTNATLVGEPTGGKPNSYGEVRTFTLPSSKLTVSYSTKLFTLLPGEDPPSLAPHLTIAPSAASYLRGSDNVLDALIPVVPKRRAIRH